MNEESVDYAVEFDEAVTKYNEWLASAETNKGRLKQMFQSYLKGVTSIVDVLGNPLSDDPLNNGYLRSDLTYKQKDVIELASDYKRINDTLDQIISGEVKDDVISPEIATETKQITQDMYDFYKDVYIEQEQNK